MVILSISKLSGNESAGININIPKFVKYLNEYCDSGYLDCGNADLKKFNGYNNFFRFSNFKNFSIRSLPEPFCNPDFVVFQTLYVPEFIKIYKELTKLGIPYTIIPRCSMTKMAQKKKFLKKKLGNILYFNKFIKNAKFIHFLTYNEYKESKSCFDFKDKVIIGNGMETPNKKYFIKNRKYFNITFIGRVDIYHKGLDLLADAVNLDKSFFLNNNITINIYGPNVNGGIKYLNNKIQKNGLENIIYLHDSVFGDDKEKVLLDCDVFIQTSRLEGHPTGVIEAISYGIPVIVTPGTNVSDEVELNNLGFVAESDINSILNTIKTAYKNKDRYDLISKNCISYAKNNFDWEDICKKIINEYFK